MKTTARGFHSLASKLRTFTARRMVLLTALLAGLVLASCGDLADLGEPTGEPGTLERVYSYPAIQGCGTCHGPGGQAENGPDMSSAASFRSGMVNKTYADYAEWFPITAQCSKPGFPYIGPGSAGGSALMAAITSEFSSKCSGSYAFHNTQNASIDGNDALIEDLKLWINGGANP